MNKDEEIIDLEKRISKIENENYLIASRDPYYRESVSLQTAVRTILDYLGLTIKIKPEETILVKKVVK